MRARWIGAAGQSMAAVLFEVPFSGFAQSSYGKSPGDLFMKARTLTGWIAERETHEVFK